MLKQSLELYDFYTEKMEACDAEIEPPVWNDVRPDWGQAGIASVPDKKRNSHSKNAPKDARGNPQAFVSDQWRGLESGGWVWSLAGADGDNGSGEQRRREVSDREAFLFVAGIGAQARYYRGQSVEQSNAQDEESGRAGISHGSAIGEEGGLSVWGDVSAVAITARASAGNGGNGTCDSAGGVQNAQVQSGI